MRYALLIAAIVVLATGCKKEEETDFSQNTYCWSCLTSVAFITNNNQQVSDTKMQTTICGKTKAQMEADMKNADTATVQGFNGYKVTRLSDCKVQ